MERRSVPNRRKGGANDTTGSNSSRSRNADGGIIVAYRLHATALHATIVILVDESKVQQLVSGVSGSLEIFNLFL